MYYLDCMRTVTVLLLGCIIFGAQAGVVINTTRVIYNEGKRETSVRLTNTDEKPFLVQSWIDTGNDNETPSSIQVPFVITPPINRINAGKGQSVRIFYTEGELSKEVESVFWLNVLAVPSKSKKNSEDNHLKMAFRTRIKLFYRPSALKGSSSDAVNQLIFNPVTSGLKIDNPTGYHISITNVSVNVDGGGYSTEGTMISPKSTKGFYFDNLKNIPKGSEITISYIDDYGALNVYKSKPK
ncbi:molecular chaperone [Vibrio sp. Sgm 22]|uniref:fimbrial biogenesis chaperone n=1 Tax=unclassified Vibrio TaxID=2614977 RepID=UPI002248FF87|nr:MULTISPECIES: molecular chaperone [unclassified Vibrio]MCX2757770.1 molecular chaperone [Vibrio sp. 14G-20]MCX2774952.1 molecular chaperone [Vibrio sp. Sgm 22]